MILPPLVFTEKILTLKLAGLIKEDDSKVKNRYCVVSITLDRDKIKLSCMSFK